MKPLTTRSRRTICGVLLLVTTWSGMVWAQEPVGSVADLARLLRRGDVLRITASSGQSVEGAFEEAAGAALSITVDGTRRQFSAADIRQVDQRLPDPRWNGVALGAGVGIAAGVVWARALCGGEDRECLLYSNAVGIPLWGGIGVAAGAAIDFAIRKYQPILVPPATAGPRVIVTPAVSPDRTGVAVAIAF